MRILCFSKRRPQGRDLLTRPYGRFYNLPVSLANEGHSVKVVLTSYQSDPHYIETSSNVIWQSLSPKAFSRKRGLLRYLICMHQLTKDFRPDWIIGFSDTWYGILAYFLARRHGAKTLIDTYDNYESYITWAKPLHWIWRYCLKNATALSAAGQNLADLISKDRQDSAVVVPMAADPCFYPMVKNECRLKLGIPLNKTIFGYTGSIFHNRGIDVLFAAFAEIRRKYPEVQLVMSGRKSNSVTVPEGVIWLGYLPDDRIPLLMNSLDLLVVLNKGGAFGDFSYPAKLYEAMRCEVPVVATDTIGVRWILRDEDICLVDPNDVSGLVNQITTTLRNNLKVCYSAQNDWGESFKQLHSIFQHR